MGLQQSALKRGLVWGAMGLGLFIAALWWRVERAAPRVPGHAEEPKAQLPWIQGTAGRPQAPVGEAQAKHLGPMDKPDDLSQAQWDALNEALALDPNRDRERARVVSYLRYQKKAATWWQGQDSQDQVQRQALAAELVDQLPLRLANREITGSEAEGLLTSAAQVLEADPNKRAPWLAAQHQRWAAAMPPADREAEKKAQQQSEEYARQAEAIAQRWLATPESRRDQAAMERELQRLREKVFGAVAP